MKKKPKKKTKGRTGRPKTIIDWEELDKLCFIQCTCAEIAGWFRCSTYTIDRLCKEKWGLNFTDYFNKKSVGGRISLRRKQFQIATAGNVPLLIFLGKQYLGQTEGLKPKEMPETKEIDWDKIGATFARVAEKIATRRPEMTMD